MMVPQNHKTVILLDHGPNLLAQSKELIEFDVFSKTRAPNVIPLTPLTKSMWTCNVEAYLEYARIVYDIFPTDKLLATVACDKEVHVLNSWTAKEQSLLVFNQSLATIGPPTEAKVEDSYLSHGLNKAIELLCQITEKQEIMMNTNADEFFENQGSIVCMTHFKNDSFRKHLEQQIQESIIQLNEAATASEIMMPLSHCKIYFVHVTPVGTTSSLKNTKKIDVSPLFSTEVHVCQSGHFAAEKLVQIAMLLFNLSSTTVTGIPMKEEQNSSSSANYDVELLHPKEAHSESGFAEILPTEKRSEGTVTLKWCTPKSNVVELHQCMQACRISPVDVNSRPSSCLTNFLLSGRAVMLEQPRKTGTRVISHMLACHGGEIYIHALCTARSILEDPPSISEGSGGRVTDYRINDFGMLMRLNRLIPSSVNENVDDIPIVKAKKQLERMTRFWPMVIGETIIFNMLKHLDPLYDLMLKKVITEDEVCECKKNIYRLVGMEDRNEQLPVPPSGSRGKGPKREEHYRQMWNELERFIQAHAVNSLAHTKVLECLLECKKPSELEKKKNVEKSVPKVEIETDMAWKELDKFSKMTEREKIDMSKESKMDIDVSPPKRSKTMGHSMMMMKSDKNKGLSLSQMWRNRLANVCDLRNEFTGRIDSAGPIVNLYQKPDEIDDIAADDSNAS